MSQVNETTFATETIAEIDLEKEFGTLVGDYRRTSRTLLELERALYKLKSAAKAGDLKEFNFKEDVKTVRELRAFCSSVQHERQKLEACIDKARGEGVGRSILDLDAAKDEVLSRLARFRDQG